MWRETLLKMKRAGFNTVQTYIYWNFQEPKPGVYNFTGDGDLDAWLKLVHSLGMYATCRIGPYACAEWNMGGYPVWLKFVPGLQVRNDNPQFVAAVDTWLKHLLPIVVANQIDHGGSVIFVQMENEHPAGWGTDTPNDYFKNLLATTEGAGVDVPHFFSGLHHGSDPGGDNPFRSAGRKTPWYTTEFWPGWYSDYGPLNAGDLRKFDRGTWKIIANGGNGYNYYMLYGGTNFGYWNNNEDAASYDYSGAIGQAGDLRPIYYKFKRAAWFARSFPEITENSDNSTDEHAGDATDASLRVRARTSPAGTIVFLDNNGNADVQSQVKGPDGNEYPKSGAFAVHAGEIMPIVENYTLNPSVHVDIAATRILAVATEGPVTTLVTYGPEGANGDVMLTTDGAVQHDVTLKYGATPDTTLIQTASGTLRIVAESETLADHTWFDDNGNIIVGPSYVGDIAGTNGKVTAHVEEPGSAAPAQDTWLFTAAPQPEKLAATGAAPASAADAPSIGAWTVATAPETGTKYNDSTWMHTDTPQQMGADGDNSAYAWYRTTVSSPTAGASTLSVGGVHDLGIVYVNGQRAGDTSHSHNVPITLNAGSNSITILASQFGRDKLFGYVGPIANKDPKGITGDVILGSATADTGVAITNWRFKATDSKDLSGADPATSTDGAGWADAAIGKDTFNGQPGWEWFRTTLPDSPGSRHILSFQSVDDNGDVYLNNKLLVHHEGYGDPFDVNLDSAWKQGGPNVVAVLIQNTSGVGGLDSGVTLAAGSSIPPLTNWRMRGGPGELPDVKTHLASLPAASTGLPTWYVTHFTAPTYSETGAHPILRFSTTGLSRGFVWLNGHNLGRYPEKVPVDGEYLPECYMNPGQNTLIVFDEDGNLPTQAHLRVEEAASRTQYVAH
jgi:beta-galactosidase